MGYKRFEELPVWQTSIELALATYAVTAQPAFQRQRSLRDQLERAALSVSNNIAEGFERGTNTDIRSSQDFHAGSNPPAFSKASATRSSLASSKCLARSCMPTGRCGSPLVFPQGTQMPGMPARLAVTV
jgi:hypothetical protein